MKTCVRSPSNIAVVKYMGKKAGVKNEALNSSISLTLKNLCTVVEVQDGNPGIPIEWLSRRPETDWSDLEYDKQMISKKGIDRATVYLEWLYQQFDGLNEKFKETGLRFERRPIRISTANTFPAGAGIASSASSFSALTVATVVHSASSRELFQKVWAYQYEFRSALAHLSRQGSGSSGRSFFGPWTLWNQSNSMGEITSIPSSIPDLVDLVCVVDSGEKSVGSSEAHQRVLTSPLWKGRMERAEARVNESLEFLKNGNLEKLSKMAWAEFWDMHSLFHTSENYFSYFRPDTIAILNWISEQRHEAPWNQIIVTMDAGPNVHILVDRDRALDIREKILRKFPDLKILSDSQGYGPEICITA